MRNVKSVKMQAIILIMILVRMAFGAPAPTVDGDEVISHAIDPNNAAEIDFSDSSYQQGEQHHLQQRNDKIISSLVNINDENTASLLNGFNISRDEIMRRINTMQQQQTGTTTTAAANVDPHVDDAANAEADDTGER